MQYETIQPCALLRNLIKHFWVGTWDKNTPPNSTHFIIASSVAELTFAFEEDKKHAELLFSSVQGHTHKPNQYIVDGFRHLLGVAFYSHAVPYLFNIPALELHNQYLSLDTLLGGDANRLKEQIMLADSTPKRIDILSDYFIRLLREPRVEYGIMIHAIEAIRKKNGAVKIMELSDQFGLSQRQFNRRFKIFSGFNPKMYSRIVRFESAIANFPNASNLTELAYLNEYHDQAHFIHDFKSFTAFSPKNFWKLNNESN